jgi:rhodanese-related sulfurtransferase
MRSREELLDGARENIPEMTVQEVHDYLEQGNDPVLLDVRGLDEWERGHLKGAVHIPRGELENRAQSVMADKSREIIVICAGGVRSLLAGETLKALGYEKVISMDGGYGDWEDAHLPAEIPPPPEETGAPENPDILEGQIEHLEKVLAEKKQKLAEIQ